MLHPSLSVYIITITVHHYNHYLIIIAIIIITTITLNYVQYVCIYIYIYYHQYIDVYSIHRYYSSITSLARGPFLVLREGALLEGLGRIPDPCDAAAHSWQKLHQSWPFPWPDVSKIADVCMHACMRDYVCMDVCMHVCMYYIL